MAGKKSRVLLLRKSGTQKEEDTEGVWNFPMTQKGKLVLQWLVNPGNEGICLALTDHFSISGDRKASLEAPLRFTLKANSSNNRLHKNVQIYWDLQEKKASLFVNNKLKEEKKASLFVNNKLKEEKSFHPTHFGFNYLRAGITGAEADLAGYFIKSLSIEPVQKL